MNVIDLKQARQERDPHMSGPAKCLGCQHEWQAVAPIGTVELQCPQCSLQKGRFVLHVNRDVLHWQCGCGNDLFSMTPQGCYCPNCGCWQKGF